MTRDFNMNPLQGSYFRNHLKDILNLSDIRPNDDGMTSQQCVGAARSYANIVAMRYKIRSLQLEVKE
jgi:hypothetical protein